MFVATELALANWYSFDCFCNCKNICFNFSAIELVDIYQVLSQTILERPKANKVERIQVIV